MVACTLFALIAARVAHAQGSLTPPGAPAPLFKTLDQIEPRKTIGTPNIATISTITISEPGSYVLVGPVTVSSGDGIVIAADNVTLDLNGFTISSKAGARAGAGVVSTKENIVVRNGMIAGEESSSSGFASGVILGSPVGNGGTAPYYLLKRLTRIESVTAGFFSDCGLVASQVIDCQVGKASNAGIVATSAVGCLVDTASTYGILARDAIRCTVENSYVLSAGVKADLCENVRVHAFVGTGIDAGLARGCHVDGGGGTSGTIFRATTAVGCLVILGSGNGVTQSAQITNKYDMP